MRRVRYGRTASPFGLHEIMEKQLYLSPSNQDNIANGNSHHPGAYFIEWPPFYG
jgi:hypothetical protein